MVRLVQLIIEMLGDRKDFMKNTGWSFVFITAKSFSRVRQATLSGFMIVIIMLLFLAGAVGLFRLGWFSIQYSIAQFGVFDARRDNDNLLLKVKFLTKFAEKETQKVDELISFEDKTRLQYGLLRISKDIRLAGIGGIPTKQDLVLASLLDPVVMNAALVKENIETLIRRAELQDSTLSKMTQEVADIHKLWVSRPSIWPTEGRITSGFGYRIHPVVGESMFHEGLDIANRSGTPIYATAEGIVRSAGSREFYGNAIFLRHMDNQSETIYGHLSKVIIKSGQHVKRGELIGYMGSTGRTTGPHLHYEVRIDSKCVNPLTYILPEDVIVD